MVLMSIKNRTIPPVCTPESDVTAPIRAPLVLGEGPVARAGVGNVGGGERAGVVLEHAAAVDGEQACSRETAV